MASPVENTRLLEADRSIHTSPTPKPLYDVGGGGVEGGWKPADKHPHHRRPVDVNVLKRNMSIAKGFMDISLLTANANQLKHVIIYGDSSSYVYHVLLTGLILSLILQLVTGILLILKERFDLNVEEHHHSANLYNNITVFLVFVTLLLNVFIGSFGISVIHHPHKGVYPIKQGFVGKVDPSLSIAGDATTPNPFVEMIETALPIQPTLG